MEYDPIFQRIKDLVPQIDLPTEDQMARGRASLLDAIEDERMESVVGSRRSRRKYHRKMIFGSTLSVLLVGGATAAAATGVFSSQTTQIASINAHYSQHGPFSGPGTPLQAGTRPVLDAEQVLCDYQGLGGAAPGSQFAIHASQGSMAAPLTNALIVQACSKELSQVTPSSLSAAAPAPMLCALVNGTDTEGPGMPVVVYGRKSCASAGYTTPSPTLLDTINHRRQLEADIDGVPQGCPTEQQAVNWVQKELTLADLSMQVISFNGGPGGSCYLPHVHWWSRGPGYIDVSAEYESASPRPGTATTSPPTTSPPTTSPPTTSPPTTSPPTTSPSAS